MLAIFADEVRLMVNLAGFGVFGMMAWAGYFGTIRPYSKAHGPISPAMYSRVVLRLSMALLFLSWASFQAVRLGWLSVPPDALRLVQLVVAVGVIGSALLLVKYHPDGWRGI